MITETLEFLKDPSKGLVAGPREGQLAMAKLVATVMNTKGTAFIEAPVGTGKSYAYLVPAALSTERTVVATAKKSLQDQLIDKDIPAVKKVTGKKFSFAVLKGASNYFCEARYAGVKNATARYEVEGWKLCMGDVVSNGDVASFPGGYPDFWPEVNATDCDGDKCPLKKDCGYMKALEAAETAHIVVTNHHVLAHALVRRSGVLGTFRTLIVDEAHQLPEALRSAQTRELSKAHLHNLHRKYLDAGGTRGSKDLDTAWASFEGALTGIDGVFPPEFVSGEVPAIRAILTTMAADVKNGTGGTEDYADSKEANRVRAKTKAFTDALLRLDSALETLTDSNRSKELINCVTTPDFKSTAREISVKPVNPGNAVAAAMAEIPAVVMTSGTLSVGGTFNHIAYETGLKPPGSQNANSTGLGCKSPFNYAKQAVLYTPKHLPKPVSGKGEDRMHWVSSVSLEIKRLIEASAGNTLILFSSNADLNDIHRKLGDLGTPYPLIAQRTGRAADAEAQYWATPNSVLLGSKSFFEGFNVPGDKLWSVIIPRLPFPVPSDPVIKTKTERLEAKFQANGMNPNAARAATFTAISVPPMLFDTIQGAGRLIRTAQDRGVLSILDPRVWTGSGSRLPKAEQVEYHGYGATVVDAIGFPRRTARFENVQKYFEGLRKP